MDYEKHYNTLIERAKQRGLRKRSLPFYTERHHIIPDCMGGKYTKENIVLLTPEEHFVAHQLLVKMYPGVGGLIKAVNMMSVYNGNHENRTKNKRYGWIKRQYRAECKKRIGPQNSSYGKSWYHHPQTLENGKFLPGDVPEGWVKGRVPKKTKIQKQKTSRYCEVCQKELTQKYAKYCSKECRYHEVTNNTIELYNLYCEKGKPSLRTFSKEVGLSAMAISKRFRRHIPEYGP